MFSQVTYLNLRLGAHDQCIVNSETDRLKGHALHETMTVSGTCNMYIPRSTLRDNLTLFQLLLLQAAHVLLRRRRPLHDDTDQGLAAGPVWQEG